MPLSAEREETYRRLKARLVNTPLVEVPGFLEGGNRLFIKLESALPTGSPFDRLYPALFRAAEENRHIVPPSTPLVECSIGSAGCSFAFVARELGYTDYTVLALEGIPQARIELMQALGAKVEVVPGDGPRAYVQRLEQMIRADKALHGPRGGDPTRLLAITKIQAPAGTGLQAAGTEIVETLREEHHLGLDHLVVVVGSGSTIGEVGGAVRTLNPEIQIHAVETWEVPQITAFKQGRGAIDAPRGWVRTGPIGTSTWGLELDRLHIPFALFGDNIIRLHSVQGDVAQREINLGTKLGIGRVTGVAAAAARQLVRSQLLRNETIAIVATDTDWKWTEALPRCVAQRLVAG